LLCNDNNLTSLNIKTGSSIAIQLLYFYNNPNLKYICCNDFDINNIKQKVISSGQIAEVNTYCTFAPAGEKNTLKGKVTSCDATNTIYKNIKVKIEDGTNTGYSLTNELGEFTFYTQTGDFTLTPILENPYFTITPATVNFTTLNNIQTQDLCITPIANKNDLQVSIIPVDLARPGFDIKYNLTYTNKGTTTLSGDVSFTFNDDKSDFVSATVAPDFQTNVLTNKILKWNFSNLKPFETRTITVTIKLNPPTHATFPLNDGDILNYTAEINPITGDETMIDNSFSLNETVVNSLDPNDKTCLQGDRITSDMIGQYVDYIIRFENTGSANAQFIVVKDIIDTKLFDVESLLPVSSSHPYHLTIKDGNVVEFYFENIQLPFDDANNDGYIAFKIKTKSTLQLGNILKNTADIYFDYNFPIATNVTQTTISNTLKVEDVSKSNQKIVFSPNPAREKITFSEDVKSVSVYDLSGKLIQSSIINGTELNVSNLQKGNYILRISTKNGSFTEKLVKN